MKKLFLLAGMYCLLQTTQAQTGTSTKVNVSRQELKSADNAQNAVAPTANTAVNARVLRDFQVQFPDVHNVSWSVSPDGEIIGSFQQPGIATRVYYSKHGRRRLVLTGYEGVPFNKDIAEQVSNSYKGYHISHVNEINIEGLPTAYLINLEVLDHIKVIRVSGDQMEEVREIVKP